MSDFKNAFFVYCSLTIICQEYLLPAAAKSHGKVPTSSRLARNPGKGVHRLFHHKPLARVLPKRRGDDHRRSLDDVFNRLNQRSFSDVRGEWKRIYGSKSEQDSPRSLRNYFRKGYLELLPLSDDEGPFTSTSYKHILRDEDVDPIDGKQYHPSKEGMLAKQKSDDEVISHREKLQGGSSTPGERVVVVKSDQYEINNDEVEEQHLEKEIPLAHSHMLGLLAYLAKEGPGFQALPDSPKKTKLGVEVQMSNVSLRYTAENQGKEETHREPSQSALHSKRNTTLAGSSETPGNLESAKGERVYTALTLKGTASKTSSAKERSNVPSKAKVSITITSEVLQNKAKNGSSANQTSATDSGKSGNISGVAGIGHINSGEVHSRGRGHDRERTEPDGEREEEALDRTANGLQTPFQSNRSRLLKEELRRLLLVRIQAAGMLRTRSDEVLSNTIVAHTTPLPPALQKNVEELLLLNSLNPKTTAYVSHTTDTTRKANEAARSKGENSSHGTSQQWISVAGRRDNGDRPSSLKGSSPSSSSRTEKKSDHGANSSTESGGTPSLQHHIFVIQQREISKGAALWVGMGAGVAICISILGCYLSLRYMFKHFVDRPRHVRDSPRKSCKYKRQNSNMSCHRLDESRFSINSDCSSEEELFDVSTVIGTPPKATTGMPRLTIDGKHVTSTPIKYNHEQALKSSLP